MNLIPFLATRIPFDFNHVFTEHELEQIAKSIRAPEGA
jgi:hypothetical protein